jgi:hypothetical protein
VNSQLSDASTERVVRRYLLNNDSINASAEELFARVQLLKILSDLREALWALAHGCMLGALSESEPPKAPGDETLPQSFYKDYFARHLERFRCSVGLNGGQGQENINNLIRSATLV